MSVVFSTSISVGGRASAPGYGEQCRQLTEARKEFG
jgi:hypothetical protein